MATNTAVVDGDEWTVATDSQNHRIIVTLRPRATLALASKSVSDKCRDIACEAGMRIEGKRIMLEQVKRKYADLRDRFARQHKTDDESEPAIPEAVVAQESMECGGLEAEIATLTMERDSALESADKATVTEGETRVFVIGIKPGEFFADIGPLLEES